MTEAQIVHECKSYLDILRSAQQLNYRIIHIPVPTRGRWQEIARSHSMAGHADCEIYLKAMRVLHIEFKTKIGRQSSQQKDWQKDLEDIGHVYAIVRSLGELKVLLLKYGIREYSWKDIL